ncbi:PxxKW family cysteine-rich protein [Desulfobotulus sp. H1]|uniref:PxxKW family cysteine-rich protein n=1 Tax=Desulfobotulus pelophilus TaxID=2823377 RepID=A0ABT3N544_9BACT|nr:PxxKW family cysteine-rich protein [Desulfobotulus pelophilus]MCW7752569.1 PxxKW family cysteine-rich protein [Desulfobotulus pelophilus]
MICTTTRKGHDCVFMKSNGCSYNGGTCLAAVEPCMGCARITEQESGIYCTIFPEPANKWKLGNCNMATHIKTESADAKKKVNPLKASKRK